MPEFLIIGAAKCGTSSLAAGLGLHPQVGILPHEVHYFSKYLDKGDAWYLAQFQHPGKIRGEKSTSYLYDPQCHREIQRLLPHVKLIVLLRNPVHRAYSNWNMRLSDKRLIREGLDYNKRKPKSEWLPGLDFEALVDYYLVHRHNLADVFEKPLDIIHRGLYADQLNHLLRFIESKNLLVLITERFFKDPARGYADVCRFLNIPVFDPGPVDIKKAGTYSKKISEEARLKLYDFYRPANEKLFALLGYPIPEWEADGAKDDALRI